MQNEMYQSEPNLIAETYRNYTNLQIPRRIEKHFDFLEISDDRLFLLGTSNLSGRLWSGSVWVFDEYPEVPSIDNCLAGIEFESSVASGLWLDNNSKIIVGCDSGSLHQLSLISVADKKNYFSTDSIACEHDDSIVSLDLLNNKTKIISGGMDMNIKVWDVESFSSEKSYCPAHGHMVTSVSSLVETSDTFISTSLDGTSLIWDIKLEKPASLLLKNDCGYLSSTWIDDKCVAIGSLDGSVSLVDLRMKLELDRNFCSKRPIFKLRFNKEYDLLAVCADDPFVRVFTCKDRILSKVYEQKEHKDFVRGLAWEPSSNILYSCAWDSKIICRKITTEDIEKVEKEEKDERVSEENEEHKVEK